MTRPMQERTLPAADGAEIFFRHWPAAGETALVVAHGNGSHSGAYARLAAHLPRVEVYAPDLRGYGASPVPPAQVSSWEGWADDLVTVAAAAAAAGKKVYLLGHSLGSLVVLAAAPRVAGLAGVILSAPSPSSKAMTPEWIQGVVGLLQAQGPAAEVRLPWGPEELALRPEARAAIAQDPFSLKPVTAGMLAQVIELLAAAEQAGPQVTAPALLLLPGEDRLVERSESLRMFGWLGSTRRTTVEFPGRFHELPTDAPAEIAQAIDEWLTGLD